MKVFDSVARQFISVDKFTFCRILIALSQPQYTAYLQTTTSFQDYNIIAHLHNSILITFLQELLYLTSEDAYIIIISFHYLINYHLDFKLSPCFESCMYSFGYFPGV